MFFKAIKTTYLKSQAAAIVQTVLEAHQNATYPDLNAANLANSLVDLVCNADSDLLLEKPKGVNKGVIAAIALAKGLSVFANQPLNRVAILRGAWSLLDELRELEAKAGLTAIESRLLEDVYALLIAAGKELEIS